ncbi:MAG: hypothetical protein LUQ39_02180 [Methanomassiliicoccales archaeon]|nr:hypothetical protein [Methanomassiliicoccales archaeon]
MSNKVKVSPQPIDEVGSKVPISRRSDRVRINLPDEMVAGSHIKIALYNSGNSRISPSDFTLKFVGDAGGCEISKALETTKKGKELIILLIAGSVPGERILQVTLKRAPSRPFKFTFKVIRHRSNSPEGAGFNVQGLDPAHRPKIPSFAGISPQSEGYPGGGGAQNVLNFGIIRIGWDYGGYSHPFESDKDWTALFGGVGGTGSGGRNVKTYYEEMQNSFTIQCQEIGTYQMEVNWNDCFWLGASYHWFPNENLLDHIFDMAKGDIETLGEEFVKSLHGLFIVVMPSPHNQAVWPCCFGPRNVKVAYSEGSPEISKYIYGIFVSEDIDEPGTATYVPDYDLVERAAHEIGHTLGMQDLRMTTSPGGGSAPLNPINDWDLMCDEKLLPQIALANRVHHSLIPDTRLYGHSIYHPNQGVVQSSGQGSNRPVASYRGKRGLTFVPEGDVQASEASLEPLETVASVGPSGLEIVITEGWSLFFEFRKRQSGQISDQHLDRIAHVQSSAEQALIGMQSKLWGKFAPYRQVEMLPHFHDGLPFFTSINLNESFEDIVVKTLETSPVGDIQSERKLGLSVKFVGIENGCAKVAIRTVQPPEKKVDPCIHPWKGYDEWISPDIRVENDPGTDNIVPGLMNTIKLTVWNAGNDILSGISVDLFAMDMALGHPWDIWDTTPIGTVRMGAGDPPIAPGGSQEFSFDYLAPEKNEVSDDEERSDIKCGTIIAAKIRELSGEITRENNFAQSRFISLTAIKESLEEYSREVTGFEVTNPYDRPVQIFITARQTSPNYRILLDKSWLRLGPNETKTFVAHFEYRPQGRAVSTSDDVNWVTIESFVRDPLDADGHLKPLSGINVKVSNAISTSMRLSINRTTLRAEVKDYKGKLLKSGKLIFLVGRGKPLDSKKMRFEVNVKERIGENIEIELPRGWQNIKAYFIPPAGYARCESTLAHK